MNCEQCQQKPATVHLIQVINGKKVETHLCEECAAKKGAYIFDPDNKFSIPNLLGSIFGTNYSMHDMQSMAGLERCPNCGISFNDIKKTGKLGCSECYQVYGQQLEPTFRRIHGNTQHLGKIPNRGGGKVLLKKQIELLKTKLQEAVGREEYEKAAEIRDSIKDMEKELL